MLRQKNGMQNQRELYSYSTFKSTTNSPGLSFLESNANTLHQIILVSRFKIKATGKATHTYGVQSPG
jgi:hypothetical protein